MAPSHTGNMAIMLIHRYTDKRKRKITAAPATLSIVLSILDEQFKN
jgi:hypothetical protein